MGGISGLSKIHSYNGNGNDIGNDDDDDIGNDNIMKERERKMIKG